MQMPNNVENNEVVRSTTEKIYYDANNIEGQMLRYRTNSLSYKLGMGAILCSVLASFISLNSLVWNASVIIKILGNIIILLFGFLSVEKVKSYSKEYSFVLCGIGAVCFARIFWGPLQLMIWYGKYKADPSNPDLNKHLGPTIMGDYKTQAYLTQNADIRAVIAIVLLVITTVLFVAAGIIGLIRAKKYAAYMSTQDVTKGV